MRKLLTIIIFALLTTLTVAQSTTPNIGLTLPNFNAPNWNIPLNNNFSIIDLVFSSGTCGDSTHALNFDASTKRIGCQTLTGGGGGGGTVTHTAGNLTLNNFILGNGGGDIKDSGFSVLPLVNGGTGTAAPNLIAGANVTITGSWPNQTINAAGAGSPAFSVITAGTNTSALLMGSGGSLGVTGSGTIGATTLLGGTWAIPGNIGSTTPATGAFTDLSSTTTGTFNNLTVTGVCTGCAGGTTAFGSITSGTSTGTLLVGTGGSLAATGTGTITASNFLGLTAGTSGGVPYFSSSSALSSSAVLTANLPVIGGGAGSAPTVGTRTGNTTQFASWTGATTVSRCVDTDASGNLKITTTDCNAGTVTSVGETFTGGLISVGGSPVTTSGTLALTVAGTSGGIPYFSGPTSWASSALLTANAVMIGGGSGATPSTISGDSTTTHALFATAGAPAFRALTSGDLPSGYNAFSNLTSSTNTSAAMVLGTGSSLAMAGSGTFNGIIFPNATETVQQGMTAGSTNGLTIVPAASAASDIPTGTQVNDINTPSSSSQSVGAHVIDFRYGEILSLFNPPTNSASPSNVSIPSGVIGNFTQLPSATSGYNEYMFGLQLNAYDGGSNLFGTAGSSNKTTWAPLVSIVNGWTPGQHIGGGATSNGYGAGDSLAWNMTTNCWGGSNARSDEGCHLGDWAVQTGNVMYTGVVASGGTAGSTSVTATNSLGNKTNGAGRPLLDVTAGSALTITTIAGSGPLTFTASGTPFTSGSTTTDSTAITAPGSQTISVGSTTGITANTTLVCIYDSQSAECVIPTAVSAGVSITANFRRTYASGANLAWGSPQVGEYIVLTPDCWTTTGSIAFTNVLNTLCQSWLVVGAPSTSTITVWYNTGGGYGTYGGNAKASAGSNAATIYPGAEVLSVQSGGTISNTMTLAPNTVTFGTDNVEQPFGPQKMEMTNTQVFKAFHTPGSIAFGAGYQISGNVNGGDCLWCITDSAANTLYAGHGGNEAVPLAFLYLKSGLVSNGLAFDEFPDTTIISSGCPVNSSGAVDCTLASDDTYKIISVNGNGGTDYFTHNPGTGSFRLVGGHVTVGWKFDGATGNFLAQNGSLSSTGPYLTATNCQLGGGSGTASPAACGAAPAGKIAIPASQTTYTVSTSAAGTNSEIFITQTANNSGLPSSPTCSSTVDAPLLTAISNGVSFTFTMTSVASVMCYQYWIVNK